VRVIEEQRSPSYFGKDSPRTCRSLATFSGFVSDTNKGTVTVEYMCSGGGGDDDGGAGGDDGGTATAPRSRSSSGRWITKPSRLARGSIQLSPRWKVKLPKEMSSTTGTTGETPTAKTVIYKGFIDAEQMIGRAGKSVSAEMVGVVLTGEEVNKEKVVGRFTADFVRQLDPEGSMPSRSVVGVVVALLLLLLLLEGANKYKSILAATVAGRPLSSRCLQNNDTTDSMCNMPCHWWW